MIKNCRCSAEAICIYGAGDNRDIVGLKYHDLTSDESQ